MSNLKINSNNKSDNNLCLDNILNELGSFGKYQIHNYLILLFPIVFSGYITLSFVFTAGELNYRCLVPECENAYNTTFEPFWLKNAVPYKDKNSPERCYRFSHKIDNTTSTNDYCVFNSTMEMKCDQFVYDGDARTILSDFDLMCYDNEWKLTLVGTINNIGQFVSLPITGYISDRYGRRITIVIGLLGSAIVGIVRSFSPNYYVFQLMEFLDPALGSGTYSAIVILAVELVAAKHRALGNTIISSYYSFGEALLGIIAMYFQNWRTLLRLLYAPMYLIIFFYWLGPESITWLISKKRNAEAVAMIQRIARINKIELSDSAISDLHQIRDGGICLSATSVNAEDYSDETAIEPTTEKNPDSNKYPILEVLKSPIILLRLLNCSFCWMTNTFVFYGLSLNSVSLSGDKYLNFIYVSLIEVPGYFATYYALEHFGRKWSLSSSLLLSGFACFASEFIPDDNEIPKLVMYLIGKLGITIAFTVLYLYTTELFPTKLRHSLLAVCSMFGRIGSMIAPQTPLLERIWSSLPLVLFGGTALVSGLLVLFFPETINTVLPDTIEEAENIGKQRLTKVENQIS